MKNILSISFIILFITTFTSNALAFRCGTEIVDRWAPAATALNKCGYPFQKDFGYENIDGRIFYVEKWFYNCGENDFIYSISIHNGIIVKIDNVHRGTGKGQCQ
jgi:hypothetical protein